MGFFRSAGIVIASVLLFVSLICMGIFLTLGMSLTHDNVNPKITSIASSVIYEQIGSSELGKYLPLMQEYCQNNSEYVFSEQGYTFSFSCDSIPNSTEEFVENTVFNLVEGFYYKEYSCKFWNCFQKEDVPLFLVSKHAQNYWMNKFYTFFIISLILIGFLILLVKKKANGLILTGSLVFIVSLLISKLKTIGTKIAGILMSPVAGALSENVSKEIISDLVGLFFSESGRVFLWMFVIGLILIAAGIILKIFKIGFKISEGIEKVQEKVSKEKAVSKEQKNISQPVQKTQKDKKKR